MASDREERKKKRLQKFRGLVAERVGRLNLSWIEIEQRPADTALAEQLMRELHTLKGDSSLMGFGALSKVAHGLETLIEAIAEPTRAPSTTEGDAILRGFDLIAALAERDPVAADPTVAAFLAELTELAEGGASGIERGSADGKTDNRLPTADTDNRLPTADTDNRLPTADTDNRLPTADTDNRLPTADTDNRLPTADTDNRLPTADTDNRLPTADTDNRLPTADTDNRLPTADTDNRLPTADTANGEPGANRKASDDSQRRAAAPAPAARPALSDHAVRVTPAQLDRMRDIIGELLLVRTRLARSAVDLRRTRDQSETSKQRARRTSVGLADTIGAVEARLRDDVLGMSNLVDALENVTRELRMVPIRGLFDRYPRAVRDLGRKLGRTVRLLCEGHAVEVDREVLEALDEPLLHLVRNAVDHGIEMPEARRDRGKPRMGTLRMRATIHGDFLHVDISDDGAGVDVATARARAVAQGRIAPDASDADVLQSLFAPGISTRAAVTDISGRGVGLDVVQDAVRRLGGSVSLHSQLGLGTSFHISVPISVAITTVVLFRVGDDRYALPASAVTAIVDARSYPQIDSIDGPAIRYNERLVPIIDLSRTLANPHNGHGDALQDNQRTIIARSGQQAYLALTGSSDHLQREVVLKSAPAFLRPRRLVTSGIALEDGSLALLLNPAVLRRTPVAPAGPGPDPSPTGDNGSNGDDKPTALVAEDSPIVRDLLAEALRSHGLSVLEAVDGADAFAQLETHPEVDLLVTDLEMPNMDGLELIRRLRERNGERRIPAIVCSTRGSDADKLAAVEVGADAYLVKNDFSHESLWAIVSSYLG